MPVWIYEQLLCIVSSHDSRLPPTFWLAARDKYRFDRLRNRNFCGRYSICPLTGCAAAKRRCAGDARPLVCHVLPSRLRQIQILITTGLIPSKQRKSDSASGIGKLVALFMTLGKARQVCSSGFPVLSGWSSGRTKARIPRFKI